MRSGVGQPTFWLVMKTGNSLEKTLTKKKDNKKNSKYNSILDMFLLKTILVASSKIDFKQSFTCQQKGVGGNEIWRGHWCWQAYKIAFRRVTAVNSKNKKQKAFVRPVQWSYSQPFHFTRENALFLPLHSTLSQVFAFSCCRHRVSHRSLCKS